MADNLDCAFVGSVIASESFPLVVPDVRDFVDRQAGETWEIILEMHKVSDPINFGSVYTKLSERGRADLALWLNDLMSQVQSPVNTEWYANQVIDRGAKHRLRTSLVDVVTNPALSFIESVEKIEQTIGELTSDTWRGWRSIKAYAEDQLSRAGSGRLTGLLTGHRRLDRALLGLRPGHVYLLGGRPSHGKTTMALQIALHIAKSVPVLYYLLETSGEALAERMLSVLGKVDSQRLLFSGGSSDEWKRVAEIIDGEECLTNLYIDCSSDLSTSNIRSRTLRAKESIHASLAIVDYLQLMSSHGKDDRERVNKISRELVRTGKDAGVPIIALSQLTRMAEYEKPALHHFKESGNLEADADVAMIIYRHRAEFPPYMTDRVEALQAVDPLQSYSVTWLEVMKNRYAGRLDTIPLLFNREFGYFNEADEEVDFD